MAITLRRVPRLHIECVSCSQYQEMVFFEAAVTCIRFPEYLRIGETLIKPEKWTLFGQGNLHSLTYSPQAIYQM